MDTQILEISVHEKLQKRRAILCDGHNAALIIWAKTLVVAALTQYKNQ